MLVERSGDSLSLPVVVSDAENIIARLLQPCTAAVPHAEDEYSRHIYLLAAALLRTPVDEWRSGNGFTGSVAHLIADLHHILNRYGREGDRAFGQLLTQIRLIGAWREAGLAIAPVITHDAAGAPPRWAEYLLYFCLDRDQRVALVGDLFEEFYVEVLPKFGKRAARFWYAKQVLSSVSLLAFTNMWRALKRTAVVRMLLDLYTYLQGR